ncbi:MAG: DNA-binding response regulator [Anaerolineae bacterium CG2_30_64_16]|nr:MAG: DNA-binding response regulator [Anaerolineae bacterium CG2_30_64_16]
MTKTRILLADDHAVLRAGLRLLIEAQADMTCAGEAGDGLETLAQAERLQPDLVLLDLSMPRLGGLAALPEIRRKAPAARILVLTMHADDEYLRQCLKGGAAGYVLKQAADQELLLAIRAVMRGEVYIHPAMTRGLLGDLVDRSRDLSGFGKPERSADLSDREAEVIKQVARGHTNQEIADRLSLSVKTVETYRARAMEKLGLANRAALVRYALEKGWLGK